MLAPPFTCPLTLPFILMSPFATAVSVVMTKVVSLELNLRPNHAIAPLAYILFTPRQLESIGPRAVGCTRTLPEDRDAKQNGMHAEEESLT